MSEAARISAALKALDEALASRPHLNGQAFTEATKAMCAYRDALRPALRADPEAMGPRRRLKAANLAITLLMAGHFPLGDTPWPQIEGLRDQLQGMLADEAA